MGAAVSGGAKDNNSFLASPVSAPYPLPSSLSHEGTLYSHFFSVAPTTTKILKCDLTAASTPDPFSGEEDHFLCVGTASKYDGGGLRRLGGRPSVGLVFVLDVSGSMGGKFHTRTTKEMRSGRDVVEKKETGTLLDAAKEALLGLLNNMKEGDSFGLVSFDTWAKTEIPLTKWNGKETKEMASEIIKGIGLRGGTNLTTGFDQAVADFDREEFDEIKMNRRIFFLTDMLMTTGNSQDFLTHVSNAASLPTPRQPIHTTVIGFGFDFDTELSCCLARIPLCNFFSVFSTSEFVDQMTWEFDYLVFPIVQNLVVEVVGKGEGEGRVEVEKVCGSNESLKGHSKETVMVLPGIFPSQAQGNRGTKVERGEGEEVSAQNAETKGGVVLAKLKGVKGGEKVRVRVRFETFEGEKVETEEEVVFPKFERENEEQKWGSFGGEGVRKGVLLARYVEFMKRYLEDLRERRETATVSRETGVVWKREDGEYEKENRADVLKTEWVGCMEEYKERINEFVAYYEEEASKLDDTTLGIWKERMKQLTPKDKSEMNEGGSCHKREEE